MVRRSRSPLLLVPFLAALLVGVALFSRGGGDESALSPAPASASRDVRTDELAARADARFEREAALAAAAVVERETLRVHVVDEQGRALAGATVLGETVSGEGGTDRFEALGETSAEGALELEHSDVHGERLVARLADYAQGSAGLATPLPAEVRIVLERGAGVTGTVARTDGLPLEEGVRVLAYPRQRVPTLATRDELERPRVDVFLADVATDGSFRVDGLQRGVDYHLIAGGPGWMSEARVEARAGDVDVRLAVAAVYGVRVRILDERGAPFDLQRALFGPETLTLCVLDPRARVPLHRSLEFALAGLEPGALEGGAGDATHVYLFDEDLERLPISLSIVLEPLGYERLATGVPVPRCRGELREHEVRLREAALSWAELTMSLRGCPELAEDGAREGRELGMKLRLTPTGQAYPFETGLGREPRRLRLPVGEYALELRMKCGGLRDYVPQRRTVVLTGASESVTFDYPAGVGVLALELHDDEGWPAPGHATLFYRREGERNFRVEAFPTPPYRALAFPAGEWEMYAWPGFASSAMSDFTPRRVTVAERAVTTVEF